MDNLVSKTLMAETIARLRKAHGLTQQEVADILKIHRSTYAYYERNVTPSTDIIAKLANLFSVSTHELMYGKPETLGHYLFKDDTNIFDVNNRSEHNNTGTAFPQLSPREKQLLGKFRLLPENIKEKICKEIEDLLDKIE